MLDEIKEPLTGQNPAGIQTGPAKEKRKHLRIYFGKCLLVIGLIALAVTLIGAGVYADSLNEWYTAWGRYGTALFKTWIIVPLLFSACISAGGVIILWTEYFRED